jgi:hypothetical protein
MGQVELRWVGLFLPMALKVWVNVVRVNQNKCRKLASPSVHARASPALTLMLRLARHHRNRAEQWVHFQSTRSASSPSLVSSYLFCSTLSVEWVPALQLAKWRLLTCLTCPCFVLWRLPLNTEQSCPWRLALPLLAHHPLCRYYLSLLPTTPRG